MTTEFIGNIIMIPIQISGVMMYKIIRLPEVVRSTGLARSTIYKKISANEFPEPISLGAKSVGWLESDIQKWIEERIQTSQTKLKMF